MKITLPNFKTLLLHSKLQLILLALAPLPILYLLLSFYFSFEELIQLESRVENLKSRWNIAQIQEGKEKAFLTKLGKADHFYLDKHLESLRFVVSDVQHENRLLFAEEQIRRADAIQEIEERQQLPIEIEEEDLKKLLTLIEGAPIGPYQPIDDAPQLIIKQFNLTKKSLSPSQAHFLLTMHLLKRESVTKNP